jgi:hypothetical protein
MTNIIVLDNHRDRGSERRQAMIDRLDQLNGGGSASNRGDLAIDDLAEEARGVHQIARADARFLHALAAGNPQRALAAHDVNG